MIKRDPKCQLCKLSQTARTVCMLGSGNPRSDVMIIGEAPGKYEDAQGKPFIGSSGSLLRQHLEQAGIEDVYVTNAVNCRPPDNRTPTKGEIKACKKWLDYQLAMVKPKYVLLLGNVPLMAALGHAGIRKARGRPVKRDGVVYLPTYHPAYILRDPSHASVFQSDIETFKTIIDFGGVPEERSLDFTIVDSQRLFRRMIEDIRSSGWVSSDLETTGLYPWAKGAQIVSIGFGTEDHQWILPGEAAGVWPRAALQSMVEELTDVLDEVKLVGHNWKFDSLWMRVCHGVKWVAQFDTMLAHYLLDENDQHGLKYLAQKYLGAPNWDIDKDDKKTWTRGTAKYHAHDLYYTRELMFHLVKKLRLDPSIKRVFDKIMMPCVELFTDAEFRGVYIDTPKMDEAEAYLKGELEAARKELVKYGPDVNWRSPQQVAALLFDKLKIPEVEKTKTGGRSVSESVIKRINHPVAGAMLKYRAADKQMSGFIEGWRPFLVNSRLHPSFKLHGTVTGRLSCEHPNLQQVPRDKRIRSLITAPPGWTLVEADLSQIELRIAAELAGERNMLYAFTHDIDVHWLTAIREIARGAGYQKEVLDTARTWTQNKTLNYGESIEALLKMGPDAACEIWSGWKELRKKAKAVNFGYLYGMWWRKFIMYARDNYNVTVTEKQAQQSRETFFTNYPDLPDWHRQQKANARFDGYVRSLSGRKRRLPQALSRDDTPERREAERQAINSPVQSFANELNLMAAIQLYREFPRSVMHVVGTVHDAILFEVRNDHVERVTRRVLEVMSHPDLLDELEIKINVPIEAEASIGPWGSGEGLEKWLSKSVKAK